jgi:hypothetical protein
MVSLLKSQLTLTYGKTVIMFEFELPCHFRSSSKFRVMAQRHVHIDLPQSSTASSSGKGTVPPTTTSGSSLISSGNALVAPIEAMQPSTHLGDGDNNAAKFNDPFALILKNAKHEPRKQANEQTSTQ